MNSKLLTMMAVGLTTLFLSAQAFACSGAPKSTDVGKGQDKYVKSDESSSSDQDINKDQGNLNTDEQSDESD